MPQQTVRSLLVYWSTVASLVALCVAVVITDHADATDHVVRSQVLAAKSDDFDIIHVQPSTVVSTTPDACRTELSECTTTMLKIVNHERRQHGLPNVSLAANQSIGTGPCVGSYGHSVAMARSSAIWHTNPRYPRASFPKSICVHYLHAGENVGESSSGDAMNDLHVLENLMMAEPHSKRACQTIVNHACNILDPLFRHVGIGIYYESGAAWLTEDFTN